MHQIQFCPEPARGAYSDPPNLPAGFKGLLIRGGKVKGGSGRSLGVPSTFFCRPRPMAVATHWQPTLSAMHSATRLILSCRAMSYKMEQWIEFKFAVVVYRCHPYWKATHVGSGYPAVSAFSFDNHAPATRLSTVGDCGSPVAAA